MEQVHDVDITGINLPEGSEIRNYQGDLVFIGVNMTTDLYQEIRAALPVGIQARLIGWKRIPALRLA